MQSDRQSAATTSTKMTKLPPKVPQTIWHTSVIIKPSENNQKVIQQSRNDPKQQPAHLNWQTVAGQPCQLESQVGTRCCRTIWHSIDIIGSLLVSHSPPMLIIMCKLCKLLLNRKLWQCFRNAVIISLSPWVHLQRKHRDLCSSRFNKQCTRFLIFQINNFIIIFIHLRGTVSLDAKPVCFHHTLEDGSVLHISFATPHPPAPAPPATNYILKVNFCKVFPRLLSPWLFIRHHVARLTQIRGNKLQLLLMLLPPQLPRSMVNKPASWHSRRGKTLQKFILRGATHFTTHLN